MADLEARYRAYLTCLDERRFGDLAEFVHDPVVHNDRTLTVAEFQDLLRRDATEIPDLHYAIERLLVQGDQVACRIRFDCTPAASFRGIPPTGRRISFVEHVFYRYEDGRIAQMWSLIDMDAIREQLDAGVDRR
ncbi:putative ester cyclase [Pseudonocardia hierapolitana]|uniref:Putative ester cyclase n=1 Tax=Pseudonocardia hierapolitana TaxID=1128676 RepID=A0A561SXE5_9PSEU|nr:ester cyclase [Pseudonocardia hierapolitana]TWF79511.1 putative ester cyclase [Pseudonocardia hierapolitana]